MEIQDNDDIIMIVLSPSEDLVKLEFIPTMDDYLDEYEPEVKKLRYRDDMDNLSNIVTQCAHNSISLYEAYKKYMELRLSWNYTEEIDPPRFCVIVGDIVDRVYRLEDRYKIDRRKYILVINSGVSINIIREDMFDKLTCFCR